MLFSITRFIAGGCLPLLGAFSFCSFLFKNYYIGLIFIIIGVLAYYLVFIKYTNIIINKHITIFKSEFKDEFVRSNFYCDKTYENFMYFDRMNKQICFTDKDTNKIVTRLNYDDLFSAKFNSHPHFTIKFNFHSYFIIEFDFHPYVIMKFKLINQEIEIKFNYFSKDYISLRTRFSRLTTIYE
ncbi:hypothetical protein GYW75_07355 [Gilliamella sp. ESL0232]|uniref:hypothetical protein n=2 Tax=unclassified Gilliamella TaxID=2685620 RepID=UPI0015804291|nr:hypothetical protein [Gilliamella sp. ESL0232]MCO6557500.1 hypothetical protein [Gilliamella sp.]NUE96199.1 hypothetical protein [Gilliamella sp. ESL0232]